MEMPTKNMFHKTNTVKADKQLKIYKFFQITAKSPVLESG